MARPPLDAESIRRLGGLARIAIHAPAAAGLAADLSRILDYVEQLSAGYAGEVSEATTNEAASRRADHPREAASRRADQPHEGAGTPLLAASAGHAGRFVRVPPG